MKFLVVSKSEAPFPPEMAMGLVDVMQGWTRKYTASGKLKQV